MTDITTKDKVKLKFSSLMQKHLIRGKHIIKVIRYSEGNEDILSFRVYNSNENFSMPPLLEIHVPIVDPEDAPRTWLQVKKLIDLCLSKYLIDPVKK